MDTTSFRYCLILKNTSSTHVFLKFEASTASIVRICPPGTPYCPMASCPPSPVVEAMERRVDTPLRLRSPHGGFLGLSQRRIRAPAPCFWSDLASRFERMSAKNRAWRVRLVLHCTASDTSHIPLDTVNPHRKLLWLLQWVLHPHLRPGNPHVICSIRR